MNISHSNHFAGLATKSDKEHFLGNTSPQKFRLHYLQLITSDTTNSVNKSADRAVHVATTFIKTFGK